MKTFLLILMVAINASAQTNLTPDQALAKIESERNLTNLWATLTNKTVEVIEAKSRITQELGSDAQVSFIVQIANRNPHFVLNDVQVELLDKDGFILAREFKARFETPANTTNVLRGITLLPMKSAKQVNRVEVHLEEQKWQPKR